MVDSGVVLIHLHILQCTKTITLPLDIHATSSNAIVGLSAKYMVISVVLCQSRWHIPMRLPKGSWQDQLRIILSLMSDWRQKRREFLIFYRVKINSLQ
jgi:hypothetical protein